MKLGKEIMNKMRSPTKKQQPSKENNTNSRIKNIITEEFNHEDRKQRDRRHRDQQQQPHNDSIGVKFPYKIVKFSFYD